MRTTLLILSPFLLVLLVGLVIDAVNGGAVAAVLDITELLYYLLAIVIMLGGYMLADWGLTKIRGLIRWRLLRFVVTVAYLIVCACLLCWGVDINKDIEHAFEHIKSTL